MDCYQLKLDERLGRNLDSGNGFKDKWGGVASLQKPFLLICHMNDPANEEKARKILSDFDGARQLGCYFLFVKGSAYGGLDRKAALAIQEEYHPQVHFLSYAVSEPNGKDIAPIKDKWDEFFRRVEENDEVDWDLIDSDWPENLVALYLLACAVENDDLLSEEIGLHDEGQDNLMKTILEEANDEREMYSEQEEKIRDLRWYNFPSENESWKSVIETCLREANPHANR